MDIFRKQSPTAGYGERLTFRVRADEVCWAEKMIEALGIEVSHHMSNPKAELIRYCLDYTLKHDPKLKGIRK